MYLYFSDDRNKYNGDVLVVKSVLFENETYQLCQCQWYLQDTKKIDKSKCVEPILVDKTTHMVLNFSFDSFIGFSQKEIEPYLEKFFKKNNKS